MHSRGTARTISVCGIVFAPPGATFQINVRPPLRMISGVSCPRKSRNPRCWWTWLGGEAAAPSAVLRFGRCPGCVVKVFGEISDVLPSDAHQMARYRSCTWEIAETTDIGQNPDTSWIFVVFRCFEHDKLLETFSTSTTLRVRRSVRCLGLHSRRNIRKTSKIEQISRRIQLKKDTRAGKLDEYVSQGA